MSAPARKRVLCISPHFPPDGAAGTHRMRVLAPYLPLAGWQPTVLTVSPDPHEAGLDPELAAALPDRVEVVRCAPMPARLTRRVGVGDLGLRALPALRRAARRLLAGAAFDAIYITTFPVYPAVLGPSLRRAFRVPFVLDLQDPWVSAWGQTVGPAAGGRPDARSRLSRAVAVRLERRVLPRADALTSVSSALLDGLAARYPELAARPRDVLPIGFDPADLTWARTHPAAATPLPRRPGALHVRYVGTVLPLGHDTIRALFTAAARAVAQQPALAARLQFDFVGTSNQTRTDAPPLATPLARDAGVDRLLREHPPRLPFFDALRAADAADVLLLLGTREARYTASKLDVALATGRPILAVFHAESDVARALAPLARRDRAVELVTYSDAAPVTDRVDAIAAVLTRWADDPPPARTEPAPADRGGPQLAARLARLLDALVPVHA